MPIKYTDINNKCRINNFHCGKSLFWQLVILCDAKLFCILLVQGYQETVLLKMILKFVYQGMKLSNIGTEVDCLCRNHLVRGVRVQQGKVIVGKLLHSLALQLLVSCVSQCTAGTNSNLVIDKFYTSALRIFHVLFSFVLNFHVVLFVCCISLFFVSICFRTFSSVKWYYHLPTLDMCDGEFHFARHFQTFFPNGVQEYTVN